MVELETERDTMLSEKYLRSAAKHLACLTVIIVFTTACGNEEGKDNARHEQAREQTSSSDRTLESPQGVEVASFIFLREETFSCGGQTNRVKIYRHERTGLEFVLVPAGSGVDSFLICRIVCTQSVWKRVMESTPWKGQEYVKEGDDYPATYVSWDDSVSFCEKAGLRLPVEKEWEHACRAGTSTKYCFGDSDSEFGNYAWSAENVWDIGEKYAHRVGRKKPNAFGLFDVHGNVWEWCQDLHTSGSSHRVTRGGCWSFKANVSLSAERTWFDPDKRIPDLGFRPASPDF